MFVGGERDLWHRAELFRRQQFRAIPLYLQHLLFEVSAWDPAARRGYTVNPDNYNRQLFQDGKGLLPAQFEAPADEAVAGLLLEENSPSPVDAMRQLSPAVLGRIKINKRYQVRLHGACGNCPSSIYATIMGIEEELRRRVPEVEYLEAVP